MNIQNLSKWVIQTDRRLIVLQALLQDAFVNASDIAQKTSRSIQNISIALKELEQKGLIDRVGKKKNSWKKYTLSEKGGEVIKEIERQRYIHKSSSHIWQKNIRFVRDAFQLILSSPSVVKSNACMFVALEKNLEDPRTRNVYVLDNKKHLVGYLPLHIFLSIIKKRTTSKLTIDKVMESTDIDLQRTVDDFMLAPISVCPEEKLTTALKRMLDYGLEDIPVVDEENRLIGELNGLEILTMFREDYMNRHIGRS